MNITDLVERQHGTRNWVLARRARRIVQQYGPDVVCLSQEQYRALERAAELSGADRHPALPELIKATGCTPERAAMTLRWLLSAGWRLERVGGAVPPR